MGKFRSFKPLVHTDVAIISGFKQVVVTVCPKSRRIRMNKRWMEADLTQSVQKAVEKALIYDGSASINSLDIEVPDLSELPHRFNVDCFVTATVEGDEFHQSYQIPCLLEKEVCPIAMKQDEKYYQGVLQLRNASNTILETVLHHIQSLASKGIAINKTVPEPPNYDLYMNDRKAIISIARKIQSQFGGKLLEDARHFSYDWLKSKNIYRTNITLFLFSQVKHDVVSNRQGRLFRVLSVQQKMTLKAYDTAELVTVDAQEQDQYSVLPKKTIEVSSFIPSLSCIHPLTFQPVPVIDCPASFQKKTVEVFVGAEQLFFANG